MSNTSSGSTFSGKTYSMHFLNGKYVGETIPMTVPSNSGSMVHHISSDSGQLPEGMGDAWVVELPRDKRSNLERKLERLLKR